MKKFPKYRIFSNDRGARDGVSMYSCLMEVRAECIAEALSFAPLTYGAPPLAPLKAIRWPPTRQADNDWLDKHVGGGK